MLRETERAASRIFIWSDEKMFTVEAVIYKQIDRFFARSPRDLLVNVRGHVRHQKPVWVMVWAAVASDGGQISFGLHWWRRETVKVNNQVYLSRKNLFLASQNFLRTNTQRMRPRSDARIISETFGSSNCGHPQVLISVPWTLLSSLLWRSMLYPAPTPKWIHWTQSFNQLWPSWTKKWCGVLALRWRLVSDSWLKQKAAISNFGLFIVF